VPVLAGPFSSDQFAAAEDLRRGGVGDAFAPNQATADELARRLGNVLGAGPRARALGSRLRARPGAELAWDLIEERAR
jgi:UDP:flavonoid glycosyltransferase YjiC (YdhE family)